MIKITFPNSSAREYNEGVTGLQGAESMSCTAGTRCFCLWRER